MDFPQAFLVDETTAGARLDAAIAQQLADFSRAVLRRSIDAGHVLVDGKPRKPSFKLIEGQRVEVLQVEPPPPGPEPEAIPLDLLYEDEHLAAVNKPPGMVVHPAKGHWAGTLASALAHHFGDRLSTTGGPTRPGIVHRLDRDTSGVIVVAKTDRAHERLAAQFADRTTEKQYLAIVLGVPDRDADVVDAPIGPHPTQRERMAIRPDHRDAREALTRYEVVERFSASSGNGRALVRCFPKTGRTHQIRVHLAHAGHPVLCDKLYGGAARFESLHRQALHAERLAIDHPETGERLHLHAPLAEDIEAALCCLRAAGE